MISFATLVITIIDHKK
ncbi:hypothetical protein [Virgibacillus halodenitrificans]